MPPDKAGYVRARHQIAPTLTDSPGLCSVPIAIGMTGALTGISPGPSDVIGKADFNANDFMAEVRHALPQS